jgi:hypothetical protein
MGAIELLELFKSAHKIHQEPHKGAMVEYLLYVIMS